MLLTVAFLGTYDRGYPRNQVMLRGLRAVGVHVEEYHASLGEIPAREMATVRGAGKLAAELARAHALLGLQHRPGASFDVALVGYPGHLVVPWAWAVARYRRAKLVFDPLVSLHDTFAGDRALVGAEGLGGRGVWAADRVAFGLPDAVLADTQAHADYYWWKLGVRGRPLPVVPVGALPVAGATGSARALGSDEPLVVFQYGKWSPLHGADTVLAAAARLRDAPVRFVLAGEGQLSRDLRARVAADRLANVAWLGMLSHEELRRRTLKADVCLGVFGSSAKAARVVPNKVYDALAAGRPVISRDSPAAREILSPGNAALLVPPGSPEHLARALLDLRERTARERLGSAALAAYRERFTPEAVGRRLRSVLEELVKGATHR